MRTLLKSSAIAAVSIVFSAPFVSANNLEFQFNNPNFGGNPNNGAFLFGLADVQKTATIDPDKLDSGGGSAQAPIPGIGGGGGVTGPTIVIPINTGAPTDPTVDAGGGN
ncbi:Type VIII secretion system (T8SS), CsgF protein [Roseivivax lentus]|uniref:Curli production assembly/transport component CsgF n=1 Tax=Roseivivax lentus TaxID=633194 RepID=A0A1N7N9T8_9RHOB|nr:curli assembly protein CsgF [Roseivivax lentus]SIS95143.1 Type VIII secretion system (T8SS), CsgF protein [Roseivivax lentus]